MDSANEYGILLEVVQILTDLNLTITKAYISSDGGWFMDGMFQFLNGLFLDCLAFEQGIDSLIFFLFNLAVFNVTDQDGNKVTDEVVLDYIQKVSLF